MLRLMTVFGLQALDSADGTILGTGTAMQAVLGFNAIRISRLDAFLRTVLKAGAAADSRIRIDTKTLGGRRRHVLIEGKDRALNGVDP